MHRTFAVLFLFVITIKHANFQPLSVRNIDFAATTCDWIKAYTDRSQVPNYKVEELSDCAWQSLKANAIKTYGELSTGENPLVKYPPPVSEGQNVTIFVHGVTLKQLNVIEELKHVDMGGYITMSWLDNRLKWDASQLLLDELTATGPMPSEIWTPEPSPVMFMSASVPERQLSKSFSNIKVKNTGNVTSNLGFVDFDIKTCKFNYKNYPNDVLDCCVHFPFALFAEKLQFDILNPQGQMHAMWVPNKWLVRNVHVRSYARDDNAAIGVCFQANRQSTTVRIELTMPMVFSAILVLVAPLFKEFRVQIFVKLFAMLLQFMCFQLLVMRTESLGLGEETPRIYTFYEFTMSCTIVSLLYTLVIYATTYQPRKLPPPYFISQCAEKLNKLFCCAGYNSNDDSSDLASNKHAENGHAENGALPSGQRGQFSPAWHTLYFTLNTGLSVILVVVYIIGIIIIAVA